MSANFQATSKQQGDWFENTCQRILIGAGFEITATGVKFKEAGVEVDIIATNRHFISFYITCKGSWRGERPGAKRTDTLKKAIAEAVKLVQEGWEPVILLTSHIPEKGAGLSLSNVDPATLFDIIDPINNEKRLRWLANADEAMLHHDLEARRTLFRIAKPGRGFSTYMPEMIST